ncbi:MAG: hypothetical protein LUI61_07585 [Firmicutes bacterium]|nr:hypothetical protein [Bacillota bacterium]
MRGLLNTARLAVLLLAAALALVGCGRERETLSTYSLRSPIINPGETLSADDFLFVSEFAGTTYTAEFEEEPDTYTPGAHSAKLSVTDSDGNTASVRGTYTVRSYIYETITVEIGTEITPETFVNAEIAPEGMTFTFAEDDTVTDTSSDTESGDTTDSAYAELFDDLGTYTVGIYADTTLYECTLTLVDTVAPTATPVTVHITSAGVNPSASAFVANIVDATNVTVTFAEEYDFINSTEDRYVTVVLTDEAGNSTEMTSFVAYNIEDEADTE